MSATGPQIATELQRSLLLGLPNGVWVEILDRTDDPRAALSIALASKVLGQKQPLQLAALSARLEILSQHMERDLQALKADCRERIKAGISGLRNKDRVASLIYAEWQGAQHRTMLHFYNRSEMILRQHGQCLKQHRLHWLLQQTASQKVQAVAEYNQDWVQRVSNKTRAGNVL